MVFFFCYFTPSSSKIVFFVQRHRCCSFSIYINWPRCCSILAKDATYELSVTNIYCEFSMWTSEYRICFLFQALRSFKSRYALCISVLCFGEKGTVNTRNNIRYMLLTWCMWIERRRRKTEMAQRRIENMQPKCIWAGWVHGKKHSRSTATTTVASSTMMEQTS